MSLLLLFAQANQPKIYSRGDYAVLPTTNADLKVSYSNGEITTTNTSGNTTDVSAVVGTTYAIHQFKFKTAGGGIPISPSWTGNTTKPASVSPIYLQIYNLVTPGWETLASNSTAGATTQVTLTATQSTGLSNYLDASNFVWVRVYQ